MNNSVNFFLQGKGGIGKSTLSSFLLQFFNEKYGESLGIDADPSTPTLTKYKTLKTLSGSILDEDNRIDERGFDTLASTLIEENDIPIVIDAGASSYQNLLAYLLETDFLNNVFKEHSNDREIIFHTIITGGQEQNACIQGVLDILKKFPKYKVFVWLNEFKNQISFDGLGSKFEDTILYQEYKERISIIRIPKKSKLFLEDLERLLKQHLTFKEFEQLKDRELNIMVKQRILLIKKEIFNQLNKVFNENPTFEEA